MALASTLTLDQVVSTVRHRHDALQPIDVTDKMDLYAYDFADGQLPKMIRLVSEGQLTLSQRAETQLLQRLGVPIAFFRRLPSNLKWAIANHFAQHGGYDRATLLRLVRGSHVRAFLTESYAPLDDVDVLPLVADVVGNEATRIEALDFTEDHTHLRLVFPREMRDVRPGDTIMTGLHITNSEVGLRAVHIDALVYRLVCSNGLVRAESQSRTTIRHVGDRARLKDALARAVENAKDNAIGLAEQFRRSVDARLAEPEALFKSLAQEGALTKEQLQAVLAAYAMEPGRSVFGTVNALTRAAQAESVYEDRYQLERVGSLVLARHV